MKSVAEVHDFIRRNIRDAAHLAGIQPSEAAACNVLYDRIADMILASNEGLGELVVKRIAEAPTAKTCQRKKTWKNQLRKACSAYMIALYSELDVADVFMAHPNNRAPCDVVGLNVDCLMRALVAARDIARKSGKMYGFIYFWKAA